MRKKRKIVNILILIMVFFIVILSYDAKGEETTKYQKGDLKCPENDTNCKEYLDSNGNKRVEITYKKEISDGSNIEIVKTVRQDKENLGDYYVKFKVSGEGAPKKTVVPGRINVVVIFDKSSSMTSKEKANAEKAIKSFSSKIVDISDNFYVSLIQFASRSSVTRALANTKISSTSGSFGKASHLEKALANAYNDVLRYKVDSNCKNNCQYQTVEGQNYVVIFGDGRYYLDYPSSVCDSEGNGNSKNNCTTRWRESVHGDNSVEYYYSKLKELGTIFYGVHYNGNESGNYRGNVDERNSYVSDCIGITYRECDLKYMQKISSFISDSEDEASFEAAFNEIFGKIQQDVEVNAKKYFGTLNDSVGDDFTSYNGLKIQQFNIPTIDKNGYETNEFKIEINQLASEGWHDTNDGVTLTYTNEDGVTENFNVDESPRVYWIPDNKPIDSCTGTTQTSSKHTITTDYYTMVCDEGYKDTKTGIYKDGYKVNVIVNNLTEGTTSFDIVGGVGFPTQINLNANMLCTYEFDEKKFSDDYAEITNGIKNAKTGEEIASLTLKKQALDNVLTTYSNITSDLEKYKDDFINQTATMTIIYDDGTRENVNFQSDKVNANSPTIDSSYTIRKNINGTLVNVRQRYVVEFSKSMVLPQICLNMKDGKPEDCSSETYQLDGSNKFYINTKKNGGKIVIEIPKAGYKKDYNFKLENDDEGNPVCSFLSVDKNMIFRQIELDDPFLKKYDSERKEGLNYLNDVFDFKKIIHENIWDTEAEYEYLMSKTNVNNIKEDTNSDFANSYLGRDCYFVNNEYQCRFTRNSVNGENSKKFFTDVRGTKFN